MRSRTELGDPEVDLRLLQCQIQGASITLSGEESTRLVRNFDNSLMQ
jgi:hypothetical protein